MKIVQILFLLQLTNSLVTCSLVIGENDQRGVHVSDYCPKIGVCEEGVHVMCLYYNPTRVMGPICHSEVHLSITPEYAQTFLNVINKIRSRVAKGTVKGKDDVNLPRGYGIYRVEWDEELATFAQLWANQCVLKSDLCHATKKFSDPGQTLGMIRFTIDDWKPINSPDFSNSTTLTPDKVKYAILTVLEAWYSLKSHISVDNIKKLDNRVNQFPYLVYGKVTHIGCGLSAYRESAYHRDAVDVNYNSIQIVCNFSSRVHKGLEVYTTDPPTKPGYTVRCGCPLGYDEDEDCLCYRSGRKMNDLYTCKGSQCKPSVVVLPIFHIEKPPVAIIREIPRKFPLDVRTRRFGVKPNVQNFNHERNYRVVNPKQSKKYSIFSKPPIFELPIRRTKILNQNLVQYKKDVAPRKDFSQAQRLASNYLANKRALSLYVEKSIENIENEANFHNYLNDTNEPVIKKKMNTDENVMNLLDKLEIEIKNVEFNGNNKDLFDKKIRKIYDFLVGKPNLIDRKDVVFPKSFNESDIVEKYNKILNNNQLYGKERLNFNKRDHDVVYNKKINKYKYRITNESDTKVKNIFDDGRTSRRITKDDLVRENIWHSKRDDDSLDNDRRMYYENKLLNLQRKIDYEKRNQYRQGISEDRRLRPVRPTKVTEDFPYRKAKENVNTFYMPDRARFLHGF